MKEQGETFEVGDIVGNGDMHYLLIAKVELKWLEGNFQYYNIKDGHFSPEHGGFFSHSFYKKIS